MKDPSPLDPVLNDPQSKEWRTGMLVHDWQRYVGERTRALWSTLSDEAKMAIAEDADDLADMEDWDSYTS